MWAAINLLAGLPWRWLGTGALGCALFVSGCQYGEQRITALWNADKLRAAQAVVQQATHVANVTSHQSNINQEIAHAFQKNQAALVADRQQLFTRESERLQYTTANRASTVPGVSSGTTRADADTADAVSLATRSPALDACQKLAEDSAQTTLMLVWFQRWYQEQAAAAASQFQGESAP